MSLVNNARNAMLERLKTSALYCSLHTGLPDSTGSNELTGAQYQRCPVTWFAAAAGALSALSIPQFRVPAGSTVTHAGIFDAAAGGTFLAYASVSGGSFVADQTFLILDMDLSLQTPPPTPPLTPTGVGATGISAEAITISWTASSGATNYVLEKQQAGSPPTYQVLSAAITLTSYTETGLMAATDYSYRVSAQGPGGVSSPSLVVTGTTQAAPVVLPDVPTGLTPTVVSSTQINLAWTAAANATSYTVQSGTSATGPWTTIATGVATTSFSHTGLTPATPYWYRVRGNNVQGSSAYTSAVTATTQSGIPAAPTNVNAVARSNSAIDISWTAVTGAASYRVQRSTSSTTGFLDISGLITSTSYADSGLTGSTTYYYRVFSHNTTGDSTAYGSDNATTLAVNPCVGTQVPAGAGLHSYVDGVGNKTLCLASGTYDIGATALKPGNNLKIIGQPVTMAADSDGTMMAVIPQTIITTTSAPQLFDLGPNLTQGLVLQHLGLTGAASQFDATGGFKVGTGAAIDASGGNVTLQFCKVYANEANGVSNMQGLLEDCELTNNTSSGAGASQAGVKSVRDYTARRCYVHDQKTNAFWMDRCGNKMEIQDCLIVDIQRKATFLEVSKGPALIHGNRIYNCNRMFPRDFTAVASSDVFTAQVHGITTGWAGRNGDRVKFTGTSLPGGIIAGTTYYIVQGGAPGPSGTTYKVATTVGGAAKDITSNGSGTMTLIDDVTQIDSAGTSVMSSSNAPTTADIYNNVYKACGVAPVGVFEDSRIGPGYTGGGCPAHITNVFIHGNTHDRSVGIAKIDAVVTSGGQGSGANVEIWSNTYTP